MIIRKALLFFVMLLSMTVCAQLSPVEAAHVKNGHPLVSAGTPSVKNEVTDSVTVRLKVLFGINDTTIDTTFCSNNASIDRFVAEMKEIFNDSTCRIHNIDILCSASPDGYYRRNLMLSKERGQVLAEYLSERIGVESSVFRIISKGEDWEGLRRLVSKSDMRNREKVISIIDARPDNLTSEEELSAWRKQKLYAVDEGRAWKYLCDHIFPELRAADNNIVCHFTRVKAQPSEVEISTVLVHDTVVVRDTVYVNLQYGSVLDHAVTEKHITAVQRERSLYIKTNAVGLAMLVVNAAVEYQFHRNWSVCLPVYWSGWDYLRYDRKFRCLLFQPEIRFWGLPVKGLYVGIHGGTGWYNFTLPDMDYRYQDKDGATPLFNAGLSVGYRHSLGRSRRWMMEYSVGGGYVSTSYDRFFNVPNGQLFDTHSKNFFLVDQVNVSLIYHIPLGKKGGER